MYSYNQRRLACRLCWRSTTSCSRPRLYKWLDVFDCRSYRGD
ncbi:unnamed protein product [Callosobruchus maculatus]|uniref:Uncharacterized protein n=1 Tax=Callosobruchus maculatus TaxID=64391 RepID=A0A653BH09_CALMS|nr:unnamed protein product [Callosobruchus maculatus]